VPTERDLKIKPRVHPIVPFMVGDAAKSQELAARRLRKIVENFTPKTSEKHSERKKTHENN